MQKKLRKRNSSDEDRSLSEIIHVLGSSIREYRKASIATPIIVLGEVVMEVAIPFVTAH